MLSYKVADTESRIDNVHNFKAGCDFHPMGNQFAKQFRKIYRYMKINRWTYVFKAIFCSYDSLGSVINETDRGKKWISPYTTGLSQLTGSVPFYLSWDMDGNDPATFSVEDYTDDPHCKKLYFNENRSVKSVYNVPDVVRRYITCSSASSIDWSKDPGSIFTALTGEQNFRAPNNFQGGMTNIFDTLLPVTPYDPADKFPFKILLTCEIKSGIAHYNHQLE